MIEILRITVVKPDDIRNKLGESLGTLQKFDTPLQQATTPSLEALKAFSSGNKVAYATGAAAAIPFFKHAIELDPNFALAYALMGRMYGDLGESGIAADYTRKAYELRNRASEAEKYFISASFQIFVTGDIKNAEQTCQLWIQAYPRAETPHDFLAGIVYQVFGQYEKALQEASEAVRLNPDFSISYSVLMLNYVNLDRLDEAKAVFKQAADRKIDHAFLRFELYIVAFLQSNPAAMAQQVAWGEGKPTVEDVFLTMESDTAAYAGRLSKAREFSRTAIDSADRAQEKDPAAVYLAVSGLREALFGNSDEARRRTALALKRSTSRDVQYGVALALAYAGDVGRAQALGDDLGKRFPEDTLVQVNYLPTLRAKIAISNGKASDAVEALRATSPYDLGASAASSYSWTGFYPVFVRGEAFMALHQGGEAALEFRKILDNPGAVVNEPIGTLAHLQLARACAMSGDKSAAHTAYRDFLTLWKDADRLAPCALGPPSQTSGGTAYPTDTATDTDAHLVSRRDLSLCNKFCTMFSLRVNARVAKLADARDLKNY